MATREKPVKKKIARKKPVARKKATPASLPLADGIPVHCAHDKIVKRDELQPNPRNPNQHPESQIDLLAKVIKAQGWRVPITVSLRSGLMVRGHCRLLSAERMGVDEVPVDFQNYDTDADEWADLLADNRIAELAEPDFGVLRDLLVEMDTGAIDMDLTGFDEAALEEIMTWTPEPGKKPPEDPGPIEPPAVPQTKAGDLWILGDHRLLCGDSTDADNVARLMDGQKADMVFTDPPYNIDYQGVSDKRGKIRNDKLTDADFLDFLRQSIMPCKVIYVCCSWQSAHLFKRAMADIGCPAKAMIVWDKVNPAQHLDLYFKQHEIIFYHGPFGGGETVRGDVWQLKRQRNTVHPTMKPVELIEIALEDHPKLRVVVDLFSGSGSTLIACERMGRKCYGEEIDPGHCDVICRRWSEMTGQTPTLEDGTPFVLEG